MTKCFFLLNSRPITIQVARLCTILFVMVMAGHMDLYGQEIKKKTHNEGTQVSPNNGSAESLDVDLDSSELLLQSRLNLLTKEFYQGLDQTKNAFFRQSFEHTKKIMDTCRLYRMFKQMPKGGLLHTHSGGMADLEWFIDEVIQADHTYIYLAEDSKSHIYGELKFFAPGLAPAGFVSVKKKIQENPQFEEELYELLVLNKVGEADVWKEFEKRFRRTIGLILYRPFFSKYYKRSMMTMLEDNAQHLEVRYIFQNLYDFETDSYPMDTAFADLANVLSEVREVDPSFTFDIIYTSLKFFGQEYICDQLISAFEYSKKYPGLVSGFDLVGEEDRSNPIGYFDICWQMLDSLEEVYGMEMPIYMHAGESTSHHNENLVELMGLRNKRVGHGLNAVLFPQVIRYLKANDILVEINPWSNEILGYVDDLRNHPGRILLRHGVPCAVSNDDPGVFGNLGLAYDFFIAYLAWELTLADVKKLVYNSINYSVLTADEKQKSLKELDKRWKLFVSEMNKSL